MVTRRYTISSPIGWMHTQNDPCFVHHCFSYQYVYIRIELYTVQSKVLMKKSGLTIGYFSTSINLYVKNGGQSYPSGTDVISFYKMQLKMSSAIQTAILFGSEYV